MDQREKKEEQNKRIGWLTSVGVQLVLLILFYFIIAWREPFPPIPEYGIELGFTTSAGAPATSSPSQQSPSQTIQEVPNETQAESQPEPVEEVSESQQNIPEEAVANDIESPVQVEETLPEETTPQEATESENPTPQEATQEVDARAVMTPSETESDESSDNPSDGEEEEKEVDQRAIYGSQGTNTGEAEGANLSLAGWVWDFKPQPDDQSDQSGKIIYKIVVDSDGYLVKIETVTSTVSPTVERKYRQAVEKLTFSKTADYKTAAVSTGTITFIIKSK